MRILLVAPEFYGYWDAVKWGFEQLGHEVEVCVYDRRANLVDNLTYAAKVHVPRKLRGKNPNPELARRASARLNPILRDGQYDAIVVMNGALVDSGHFEGMRSRGIPVVLWLQDELSRLVFHTLDSLSVYSGIGSYSAKDVEYLQSNNMPTELVANGFDTRLAVASGGSLPSRRDVVFVGALSDYRAEVLEGLASRGLPVAVYGNPWSRRLIDRARSMSWSRPAVNAFPSVTRERATELFRDALCGVNLHVPGIQDGVNPRTFEICGIGGVQAIDREDVDDFYEPGSELLTFENTDELADIVRRLQSNPKLGDDIRRAAAARTHVEHTMEHRCRQLLDLM